MLKVTRNFKAQSGLLIVYGRDFEIMGRIEGDKRDNPGPKRDNGHLIYQGWLEA